MTNRIHDGWTDEETSKLIRYMKREKIETELHCEDEDWQGVMLERSINAITMKAIRLLREYKEEERIQNLFGEQEDRVTSTIIQLKLAGKKNEEIFELLQVKYPKAELSDVKRLANAYTQEAWHDLAKRLKVTKVKKLKDWRDFVRLHKAYGGQITEENRNKLIEILQDGKTLD